MATKYDTNPLDPDFPEKAKAAAAAQGTQTLGSSGARTQKFADPDEEQTRRFATTDPAAFPYGFNSNYDHQTYQPIGFSGDHSATRKVDKVGLPENVLTALPYIPWYIGMIAGLLILFLVPKSETKVRFHAAQGLAAHIGILIVTSMLGIVGNITDFATTGTRLFYIVTTVMLAIFAFKAWKGKPVHIESVDSLTNWLEEKISPKS